jgi:heme-degrading monooxygenase HmoA
VVHTLFFSRFRDAMSAETLAEYETRAASLAVRAREAAPGFVDIKSFRAEDGERLTLVRFETMEQQKSWSADRVHLEGKRRGRSDYYAEYRIVVCEQVEEREWVMDEG